VLAREVGAVRLAKCQLPFSGHMAGCDPHFVDSVKLPILKSYHLMWSFSFRRADSI